MFKNHRKFVLLVLISVFFYFFVSGINAVFAQAQTGPDDDSNSDCGSEDPECGWKGIEWGIIKEMDVEYGQKVTNPISAYEKETDKPAKISCVNCDGTIQLQGGEKGEAQLVFDTTKLPLVTDTEGIKKVINIKAEIDSKSDNREITFYIFPSGFLFKDDCSKFNETDCKTKNPANCFWFPTRLSGPKCVSRNDESLCKELTPTPNLCGEINGKKDGSLACKWNEELTQCQTLLQAGIYKEYGVPEGYEGILPACAFSGQCRSVNDLLELLIKVGNFLFGLIGSFAFVFFIYGGFTMIFSFGNAEKVKKGRDILVAAVVGLAIAFGAYLLIHFMLGALGVAEGFRGIK